MKVSDPGIIDGVIAEEPTDDPENSAEVLGPKIPEALLEVERDLGDPEITVAGALQLAMHAVRVCVSHVDQVTLYSLAR